MVKMVNLNNSKGYSCYFSSKEFGKVVNQLFRISISNSLKIYILPYFDPKTRSSVEVTLSRNLRRGGFSFVIFYPLGCREIFERITNKGKSKKLALIAISNKLLEQCFAIAKSGKPYDAAHVSVLKTGLIKMPENYRQNLMKKKVVF